MMRFRRLPSITEDEARLLAERSFDGELVRIIEVDDDELLLEVRTQWVYDGESEDMVDTVSFEITRFGTSVSVPWSKDKEEKVWEDFVIYFGFHPAYHDNTFEGEDITTWARNYKRSVRL